MIDWSKIETVLLDMDGTLLDLHFDNYFWHEHLPQCWAKKHDITLEDAKSELIPIFKKEEGTLQWYCLDYWSKRLEMNMIDLKETIKHKIQIRSDTIQFLQFLKQQDKSIVMVTNAHRDLIDMKFSVTEIQDYFHNIVSSHDFGVAKEEVKFWHCLKNIIDYQNKSTLLIDDNLNVLKSAKSYGIENLISIKKPDSQKPLRNIEEFDAVTLFIEIME